MTRLEEKAYDPVRLRTQPFVFRRPSSWSRAST